MLEIDLKKLKTFEAVARLRSFTAAAEELLIAQPSVSQQVQKLEESIGVPLLLRTRQGVELTDAGSIFLQEYYQTQTRFERALLAARNGAGSTPVIRIGSSYQATARFLPSLLDRFKASHPRAQIQVFERRPSTIRKAVETGELELGFGRLTGSRDELSDSSLSVETVYQDGLVVAAATGHPISTCSVTSLHEAAKFEWSLFDRTQAPEFVDFLNHCCRTQGIVPEVVASWETFHTLMTMVSARATISILPGCFATQSFPGIVFIPVQPSLEFDLVMFWSAQQQCPVTRDLVQLIRDERAAIQELHRL